MKDPNTMTRDELLAAVNDLVDRRAKLIAALVCPDCGGEIDCSDADGDCSSCGAKLGNELEHGPEIRKVSCLRDVPFGEIAEASNSVDGDA